MTFMSELKYFNSKYRIYNYLCFYFILLCRNAYSFNQFHIVKHVITVSKYCFHPFVVNFHNNTLEKGTLISPIIKMRKMRASEVTCLVSKLEPECLGLESSFSRVPALNSAALSQKILSHCFRNCQAVKNVEALLESFIS